MRLMVSQVNGETSTVRASFGLRTQILVCADVFSPVPVIHHKLLRLTTAVSQQNWSKRVQQPIPRPQETSEEVLASPESMNPQRHFAKANFSGVALRMFRTTPLSQNFCYIHNIMSTVSMLQNVLDPTPLSHSDRKKKTRQSRNSNSQCASRCSKLVVRHAI